MTTATQQVQSALNLVMPLDLSKGELPPIAEAGAALLEQLKTAADQIGTLHDARFVMVNDSTLGLFTTYDGDFDTYVTDFTKYLGPVFDALLAHTIDPPSLPVEKNVAEFIAWVRAHDLPSIHGVYSAYPALSVQDIKALAAKA